MGGLPCAKEIIDQGYLLGASIGCMSTSILLNAAHTQPTEAMSDEFRQACEAVAVIAATIEKYVREGGTSYTAGTKARGGGAS
jgi:hypothetical protein